MKASEEIALAVKGKGCLGRSALDEPVFVLVARDIFASARVREWADEVERVAVNTASYTGARQVKVNEARALAKQMDDWRMANGGGKMPD